MRLLLETAALLLVFAALYYRATAKRPFFPYLYHHFTQWFKG